LSEAHLHIAYLRRVIGITRHGVPVNRILDVFLEPLFVALLLLALSSLLKRRAPGAASAFPALAFFLLLLFSSPAISNRLVRGLEDPPLTTMKPGATYDAVIVLGGGIDTAVTLETGRTSFMDAAERLLTAFDLLRSGRAKNVILSGGYEEPRVPGAESEANVMADQLEAWGIDAHRIAVEERSTTTHENAVESVKIARAKAWTHDLLVTSAAHMPRALGCFVHEGLPVDTLAVDFHTTSRRPTRWLPRAQALWDSTWAIREIVGRFVYRLRGWTD
jgi:uncharacterized SAM-binding protein YcdF (DUF218 family)